MIDSFRVQGFRAFGDLQVPTLGRVNLITGLNNVGKTTLLEALAVFARSGMPRDLANLLDARDDVTHRGGKDAYTALFHATDTRAEITMGTVAQPDLLRIRPGYAARKKKRPWTLVEAPDPVDETARILIVEAAGEGTRFFGADAASMRGQVEAWKQQYPCHFVFADGIDIEETAALWQETVRHAREEDVSEALRVIEPRVERFSLLHGTMDAEDSETQWYSLVRLSGEKLPIPLRSLGDGMHRLAEMALALVNVGGGFLLVDEIENGLSFTVQEQMWRFLFEAATRFDVQVFATTHSWDCVKAFQAAASAHAQAGVLIRLARCTSDVQAFVLDEADLEIVARQEIEVRR